jgi:hypothetical protein
LEIEFSIGIVLQSWGGGGGKGAGEGGGRSHGARGGGEEGGREGGANRETMLWESVVKKRGGRSLLKGKTGIGATRSELR